MNSSIFLAESVVRDADIVTARQDEITKEYIITYGENRKAFIDADDAADQYSEYQSHAMQVGKVMV